MSSGVGKAGAGSKLKLEVPQAKGKSSRMRGGAGWSVHGCAGLLLCSPACRLLVHVNVAIMHAGPWRPPVLRPPRATSLRFCGGTCLSALRGMMVTPHPACPRSLLALRPWWQWRWAGSYHASALPWSRGHRLPRGFASTVPDHVCPDDGAPVLRGS